MKITEIEKKLTDHKHDYISTPEFNKLKLAQPDFVTKTDFDNKLSSLNRKIVSNKTNQLVTENEVRKLKALYQGYFVGKNHFDESGTQNYYIFQPISKYLKVANVNDINYILSWQSRGLNDVKIESIKTNNSLLNPRMDICMNKIRIKFNGSFLNQFPPTSLHGNIVNIYIVYEIASNYNDSNYPTIENCLFGSVKLTKNTDIDKYGYSGYGIGFDRKGFFSSVMKLVKM